MLGMDPEVALYYRERQDKQNYLKTEIQDNNYNVAEFAQFVLYKREKGTDVDTWTFEELIEVVSEFKATYAPMQYNEYHEQQNFDDNVQQNQNPHRQTFQQMVANNSQSDNNQPAEQDQYEQANYQNQDADANNQMQQLQFEEKKDVSFEMVGQENLLRNKVQRQFIDTKKIQENPTPLNFRRVDIKVSEGLIKEGGIFASNYITYKIETAPMNYEVRRKDSDFLFLRKILLRQFPHIIIPPLPVKAPKPTPKYIKKREKYYQRFLQAIARSEELKSSQFLLDFLFDQDPKAFQKIMKDAEKAKYPKNIEEFVTYKGQAKVQMTTNSSAFCTKMVEYADSYQILYKEMIDCAKEINEKSQELASTMYQMHKFVDQMSELNRMIKCQSQHELFAWLSKMITGSGNFIAQQGELIEKYIAEHMKYHLDEHESFREIFQVREKIKQEYVRQERSLIDKKERLFKSKDVYKWGGFQDNIELLKLKDELLQDKDKAFQFMLPKETKEVELKREELCFYTNQCWDEIRRVGNDNGRLIRDHFRDMSQIQCSYINQNHVMWADFLSHFAELAASDLEQEKLLEQQMQQNLKLEGDSDTRDGGSGGTGRVA